MCESFPSESRRREYLLGRALLRAALSRCTEVDPRRWAFRTNPHGKPEIAEPHGVGLRFSLSHTQGLLACAVVPELDVGIDVESVDRGLDMLHKAERYLAPSEARALRALPREAQPRRFLTYWTLKEAYAKARGSGMSMPLDKVSFALGPDRSVRMIADGGSEEESGSWRFIQLQPTARHIMAVAVREQSRAAGARVSASARDDEFRHIQVRPFRLRRD